jgi:hypothetical protein
MFKISTKSYKFKISSCPLSLIGRLKDAKQSTPYKRGGGGGGSAGAGAPPPRGRRAYVLLKSAPRLMGYDSLTKPSGPRRLGVSLRRILPCKGTAHRGLESTWQKERSLNLENSASLRSLWDP